MKARPRTLVLAGLLLTGLAGACHDNSLAASLTPVPPVHRVPPDVEGAAILVAEDAIIESPDPERVAQARESQIPQQIRAAMTEALRLAGFTVASEPDAPHALVAVLSAHVEGAEGRLEQTYRCAMRRPDGAPVARIVWSWPRGTFVHETEVFEFAAHNLASEVAHSPEVLSALRGAHGGPVVK